MRIAHVQHPYVPGMGYQENHLPAAQRDLGHEVVVITSDVCPPKFAGKSDAPFERGVYEYGGVEVRRLGTRAWVEDLDDVLLRGLRRELRSFDPDVVHSHGLMTLKTLQTYRFARKHDARLFVDVHRDNDNFHLDRAYKRAGLTAFRRLFLPRVLNTAEAVVPVNPYASNLLREVLDVPEAATRFLPLGVDHGTFAPDEAAGRRVRDELGVDPGTVLVVTAGNLEPTKDLDLLVRAFADVRERTDRDLGLAIVGDGPREYLDRVRTTIADTGQDDVVDLVGFVEHDRLPDYYNAADVGVWPGKLGIASAEAIATGLPVVLPESPATEFLLAGDNGIDFERGDRAALADAIARYVGDDELRAEHGGRGRRLVERELSWDRIAERSLRIYGGE